MGNPLGDWFQEAGQTIAHPADWNKILGDGIKQSNNTVNHAIDQGHDTINHTVDTVNNDLKGLLSGFTTPLMIAGGIVLVMMMMK